MIALESVIYASVLVQEWVEQICTDFVPEICICCFICNYLWSSHITYIGYVHTQ